MEMILVNIKICLYNTESKTPQLAVGFLTPVSFNFRREQAGRDRKSFYKYYTKDI